MGLIEVEGVAGIIAADGSSSRDHLGVAPDADLSVLTTDQVNEIRAAIYGADEDTEMRRKVEEALM